MTTLALAPGTYTVSLLNVGEFRQYRTNIPTLRSPWWLRPPEGADSLTAVVLGNGMVTRCPKDFLDISYGIRPVLKYPALNLPVGERFFALGNRWIAVDTGVAVSSGLIGFLRYDAKSNVWATSELKAWIDNWVKEGET